jgi:perosamine synthetase
MSTISKFLNNEILSSLESVLGNTHETYPLHEPTFDSDEIKSVADCVSSTFVSSVGPQIVEFEQLLSTFIGVKHVIAVANGTVALEVALREAGVDKDTEVLIPALSFVATANAVKHLFAEPVFIDSEESTLGINPQKMMEFIKSFVISTNGVPINKMTGRRVAAIVPMHTLGHPVLLDQIMSISQEYGIPVVEDMAESLGSFYKERHTGNFGVTSALSFNGNKIITTGGGGAIITNDDQMAAHMRHAIATAKIPHAWEFVHDEVGWNYRMPNLNASLGVAQMAKLPNLLASKRYLANRYSRVLDSISEIDFISEPESSSSNYWLCAMKLKHPNLEARNSILTTLHEHGILARPLWNLISDFSHFSKNQTSDLTIARELVASTICLPSSAHLISA